MESMKALEVKRHLELVRRNNIILIIPRLHLLSDIITSFGITNKGLVKA